MTTRYFNTNVMYFKPIDETGTHLLVLFINENVKTIYVVKDWNRSIRLTIPPLLFHYVVYVDWNRSIRLTIPPLLFQTMFNSLHKYHVLPGVYPFTEQVCIV